MKVKNKVSLALALLLAINFIPAQAQEAQPKEDKPYQGIVSDNKDDEIEKVLRQALGEDEKESDKAEDTYSFDKKVADAKAELKKYLDSMDEKSIDDPSIVFEGQTKDEIKKSIARAKELLADEDIDQAKLEEIQKIPFKKVNGKKQGLFRGYTHKALVDFEVLGKRENVNPHNNKKYVGLVNNKFTIKSSAKGLKKIGESDDKFIKLNYVTEDDYKATKVDGVSSSTPKYKKAELDRNTYTIKEIENGYEVEVSNLPAGTKFIKPIVLIKLADGTYFENGDLVYVKNEANEEKPTDNKKIDEKAKVDQESSARKKSQDKKDEKLANKKEEKPASKEKDQKKEEKPKADAKAPAKNAKTGVGSSIVAMAVLGLSSTALFASKKKK